MIPDTASRVLGLQVCTTIPRYFSSFLFCFCFCGTRPPGISQTSSVLGVKSELDTLSGLFSVFNLYFATL